MNTDEFTPRNLAKVGYDGDPLQDAVSAVWTEHRASMTSLTVSALEPLGLGKKDAERAKNKCALELLTWRHSRLTEGTERWLREKFARRPEFAEANIDAFSTGDAYGETTEAFALTYEVAPAAMADGTYRQSTGNTAVAYGIVAAGACSGLPVVLGSYPITPASDSLHELAKLKRFGVTTFQTEDEIAGIGADLGASYGCALGVTTTSGSGSRSRTARTGASCPTSVTPRLSPGSGRYPALPGSSTASAASRTSTGPATSPTTRPITSSWSGCARPRWTASPYAIWGWTTLITTLAYWFSAGVLCMARSVPRCAGCAWPGTAWPAPTCAISTRDRGQPREGTALLPPRLVLEMNLGQLAFLLQGRFALPVESITRVAGVPFGAAEMEERVASYLQAPPVDKKGLPT